MKKSNRSNIETIHVSLKELDTLPDRMSKKGVINDADRHYLKQKKEFLFNLVKCLDLTGEKSECATVHDSFLEDLYLFSPGRGKSIESAFGARFEALV